MKGPNCRIRERGYWPAKSTALGSKWDPGVGFIRVKDGEDIVAQPKTVNIADVIETQEKGWFPPLHLPDVLPRHAGRRLQPAIAQLRSARDHQGLGINRALMTPVFDINIFGWMLGSIGFSMLADRIGRRNSILLAVFIFGVFTAAMPLATESRTALADPLRFSARHRRRHADGDLAARRLRADKEPRTDGDVALSRLHRRFFRRRLPCRRADSELRMEIRVSRWRKS